MICRRCGCEVQPGDEAYRFVPVPLTDEEHRIGFVGTGLQAYEDPGVHRNNDLCLVALRRKEVERET